MGKSGNVHKEKLILTKIKLFVMQQKSKLLKNKKNIKINNF